MISEKKARERLIFPLDVPSEEEALLWVERLKDYVGMFKIGLELFTACGMKIVEKIKEKVETGIFLDLKLCDIPNTVKRTIRVLSEAGVNWVTVHSLSGREALKSATSSAYNGLRIIAVTVLTSLDRADLMELGFNSELVRDTKEIVFFLSKLAWRCGCDGVVCSAREVERIKETFPELITVVPGIRLEENVERQDDQLRTATPYDAVLSGADYIVVGRPIREAEEPEKVCEKILEDVKRALEERDAQKRSG